MELVQCLYDELEANLKLVATSRIQPSLTSSVTVGQLIGVAQHIKAL